MEQVHLNTRRTPADAASEAAAYRRPEATDQARGTLFPPRWSFSLRGTLQLVLFLPVLVIAGFAGAVAAIAGLLWRGLHGGRNKDTLP